MIQPHSFQLGDVVNYHYTQGIIIYLESPSNIVIRTFSLTPGGQVRQRIDCFCHPMNLTLANEQEHCSFYQKVLMIHRRTRRSVPKNIYDLIVNKLTN
ncbi:hypothetical protein C7H19_20085 [Aphanothece hegewaldii CCALA 016]|uniref:Uncharacterized protein n=1 Tax=Aphanothece hegewaldii CCALA 016 TaxID=2107694 RepID=A0A2T1LT40_9CHRO|nr:hypothetical protein [Aphanothece hegewaldii]PSF33471.1 hypothetical protein C7H19_20085 [Aphanothece hegewaldii CCALA 016]